MKLFRHFALVALFLVVSSAYSQFSSGRNIAKDDASGLWYLVTGMGQIWEDDGMGGFDYAGAIAGANAGGMLIANGKMYVVRINTIKVYDLDPVVLVDTWTIPVSDWLVGLCWDGDTTLYCHDQVNLYGVSMNTGQTTTLYNDIAVNDQGMEYDPFGDRVLIVRRAITPSVIMAYDLQANTYDSVLVTINAYYMRDIYLSCNGSQFLISAGGTQDGIIYSVPSDLSHVGDTAASTYSQPWGLCYDAVDDILAYATEDSVPHVPAPCILFTDVPELEVTSTSVEIRGYGDELFVLWENVEVNEELRLHIYDPMGRSIRTEQVFGYDLVEPYRLNVDGISNGAYILVLEGRTGKAVSTLFTVAH